MAVDHVVNHPFHWASPGVSLEAVTPNDDTDLTMIAKALYVGVGGDVALIAENDSSAVTMKNVSSGQYIRVRTKRVMATNTDATDIVAIY